MQLQRVDDMTDMRCSRLSKLLRRFGVFLLYPASLGDESVSDRRIIWIWQFLKLVVFRVLPLGLGEREYLLELGW